MKTISRTSIHRIKVNMVKSKISVTIYVKKAKIRSISRILNFNCIIEI